VAEEQGGLSYTIRFIPDTTAIDGAITDIAKRVEEEVGQAIRKARVTAGVEEGVPAGAVPAEGAGVVDRLISEFRSVKERITGMMQKYGILAGEAMALSHPAGRTLGEVVGRIKEKLAVTPLEDLSEDLRLLIGATMTVITQQIKAVKELRPDLSEDEATMMVMSKRISELKGIASKGVKHYATMIAAAKALQLADYYGRPLEEAGEEAPKTIQKLLAGIVTHKIAADVGKKMLDADGQPPDWVAEEVPWTEVFKYLGATEDQIKEWGIAGRIRAADRIRLAGGGIKLDEFGGTKTGRDFSRDVRIVYQLLQKILETPRMAKRVEDLTGRPVEELDVEAVLATVPFGAVETVVGAEEVDREKLTAGVLDIGDELRATLRDLIPPEFQYDKDMTEILDYLHKILESMGTSPTPAVLPRGPPEGLEGEMDKNRTGGIE